MKKKRGRPRIGITKKVSLTLTESEWAEIEASGLTVAAFLKKRMKAPVADTAPVASAGDPVNYPRRYVEERWNNYLRNAEEIPAEIIEAAKSSMLSIMYPNGSENAVVRTHQQYECPFTGKRFGSMDKLVRAAIPHLIEREIAEKKRKAELKAVRERKNESKLWIDM